MEQKRTLVSVGEVVLGKMKDSTRKAQKWAIETVEQSLPRDMQIEPTSQSIKRAMESHEESALVGK